MSQMFCIVELLLNIATAATSIRMKIAAFTKIVETLPPCDIYLIRNE